MENNLFFAYIHTKPLLFLAAETQNMPREVFQIAQFRRHCRFSPYVLPQAVLQNFSPNHNPPKDKGLTK